MPWAGSQRAWVAVCGAHEGIRTRRQEKQTSEQASTQTNKEANKQTNTQANKQTSKQANKQASKQARKKTSSSNFERNAPVRAGRTPQCAERKAPQCAERARGSVPTAHLRRIAERDRTDRPPGGARAAGRDAARLGEAHREGHPAHAGEAVSAPPPPPLPRAEPCRAERSALAGRGQGLRECAQTSKRPS